MFPLNHSKKRKEIINLIQLWGHDKLQGEKNGSSDKKGIPQTDLPKLVETTPWGISIKFSALRDNHNTLLLEANGGDEKQSSLVTLNFYNIL